MKLWHILAGAGAGLLLLGTTAFKPKGGGSGGQGLTDPNTQNRGQGQEPTDYPEPPVPGDVQSNWRKPDSGWSKIPPTIWMPVVGWIPAPNARQDSKGYWWLVVKV